MPPRAEEDRVDRNGEDEECVEGEASLAQGELDGVDQNFNFSISSFKEGGWLDGLG